MKWLLLCALLTACYQADGLDVQVFENLSVDSETEDTGTGTEEIQTSTDPGCDSLFTRATVEFPNDQILDFGHYTKIEDGITFVYSEAQDLLAIDTETGEATLRVYSKSIDSLYRRDYTGVLKVSGDDSTGAFGGSLESDSGAVKIRGSYER